MWDIPVITDRTIPANRPDTVTHDTKEKTCLLINIAISYDWNINTKETEKLNTKTWRSRSVDEDTNCASYNWSIRNKQGGIKLEPSVAP